VDFKFAIHDKVKITELGCIGRIVGINITDECVKYYVRYFDKAEAKTVYFYVDELEKIQEEVK